jgi:hypothetical protein
MTTEKRIFNTRVSAEEHRSLQELRAVLGLRSSNEVIRKLIRDAAFEHTLEISNYRKRLREERTL